MHFLTLLTGLGKWKIYTALFLLAGLYFRYIDTNPTYEARSWYLFGCILIPNLIGFFLKIILSRARPDLLFESNYYGFYWFKLKDLYWCFPSGHAITVIGLAFGIVEIAPKFMYVLLGIALLVACSRVLLYHHYLSDVMTGFYLSMLIVGLFTQYLRRNQYQI